MLIDQNFSKISVARQCQLLGLARSSFYYSGKEGDPLNLELMRKIDEQYTKTPFFGVPRMTYVLRRQGFQVNHKRVARLMLKMGIQAIFPGKKKTSISSGNQKFPYLLVNLKIVRPNQVWASDITYIRLSQGFVYLTVVMDWFSRYVLAWSLSNTMDTSFCVETLESSFVHGKPEIFNSDQGSQYTSQEFVGRLKAAKVAISMDGRGRVFDNIFVERLWRSVKYEEVYLKDYQGMSDARKNLDNYFRFYNKERPHQSLGYKTPGEVYEKGDIAWN